MPEFSSEKELESWLGDKAIEWSVVVGVRTALRALMAAAPDLQRIFDNPFESRLPAFCSSAAHWFVISFPSEAAMTGVTGTEFIADAAKAIDRVADSYFASEADAAFLAIESSAKLVMATSVNLAAAATSETAGWAELVDIGAYVSSWNEVNLDCDALETGTTPAALAATKLWHQGDGKMYAAWNKFCAELLTHKGENWQVWVDWFQDRIAGRPGIEVIELDRVNLITEHWEDGPVKLNGLIAQMEADHRARIRLTEREVAPKPVTGDLHRKEQKQTQEVPGDVSNEDIIRGAASHFAKLITHYKSKPELWQRFGELEFEFDQIEVLQADPVLDPSALLLTCQSLRDTMRERRKDPDSGILDDPDTKRVTAAIKKLIDIIGQIYPRLAAVSVGRGYAPPPPLTDELLAEIKAALTDIVPVLDEEFRSHLQDNIKVAEQNDLPPNVSSDRASRGARRRLAEYLLKIQSLAVRSTTSGYDWLTNNVDPVVKLGKKIAEYKKAFAGFMKHWDAIKDWIMAYVSGGQ